MGEKSEIFCRQTLMLLGQNTVQPRAAVDDRADDTKMALGRDLLSTALEGYAIAKAFGKDAGLDALKEAMATRFSGKRRAAKPGA